MAVSPSLPSDPRILQQLVVELQEQLAKLLREKESLQFELERLARQLFGRRSERIDPNQLTLPELTTLLEALGEPAPAPPLVAPEPEPKPRRRPRRRQGPRFEDLPRERRVHELADEDRLCPCCRQERRIIRWATSEQLEYRPATFFVIEHARPVAVCTKGCDDVPAIAPKPPQPIEKGLPGPGLLAHVAISKYEDHQPLHRLERIFRRHGVEVSRSTMCDWIAAIAQRAGPLVEHLRQDLLRSRLLATDETTVPVLEEKQKTTKKGRLWVYVGDDDHPWVVFDYTPTREGDGPERFLKGFEGYLQADAYSGFDRLYADGNVKELGCWMHARRYFYEAAQSDPTRPCEALAFIRELYLIERELKEAEVDERRDKRIERAKPVLEALDKWIRQQSAVTPPKSPLAKALGYASRQWTALTRYADHGDLPIDNGRSERELRAVAIGRKNWTFAGSDAGAVRAGCLYSLIASCRRNRIDTFSYLRDLLERLPTHPAERIAELTPLAWKAEIDARSAEQSVAAAG